MVKIEQSVINEVCNSLDIVDVISNYVSLSPRGNNYFGLCPFHPEKTPSFVVSKDKQIFHCFGCEPPVTGNVISFIMKKEELSFLEALKRCAEMAGIDIGLKNYKDTKYENNVYKIYDDAMKLYQNAIFSVDGRGAREYLENRGISDDIIKEFKIGFATTHRDMLTKYLNSKKYTNKDILKSGLVLENNGFYDIYRNRIMIPITDDAGQVVGFSGRTLDKSDPNKYINSQTSDIFKKSELFYNYFNAKDEIKRNNRIMIMEGFFDVIMSNVAGIKYAVATMGTAVTKDHIHKLKHLNKEVVLCFDGDKAGIKATLACSTELLKNGIIPKIVILDNGMDPDEYIRKYGNEDFRHKVENPISYIDFKFNYLKEMYNLNDSVEMAKYANELIEDIKIINNDTEREIAISKLSKISSLDISFIKDKINKKDKIKEVKIEKKEKVKNNYIKEAEEKLIYYMLMDKNVILMYKKKIQHMPDFKYRNLANEIRFFYDDYGYINISEFMNSVISDLEKYKVEEIEEYIKAINDFNVINNINSLKNKALNSNSNKDKAKLAEEILKIRKGEY